MMPGKRATEDQRRNDILKAAFRVASAKRLEGVTSRAVAAEASVSNGLVFFYFGNREELLLALLDWLLANTLITPPPDAPHEAAGNPADYLISFVSRIVERLPGRRARIELFFEYWFLARRNTVIRRRIRTALDQSREAYLPLAAAVIAADPVRYRGVTAESLTGVVTGFMEGCALQAVVNPKHFDVDAYLYALRALILRPA